MNIKDQTRMKVSSILQSIFLKAELKMPFNLTEVFKDLKITHNAQAVIGKKNLYKRVGKTPEGDLYKWIGELPNDKMIDEITFEIKEYNRLANIKRDRRKPKAEEIEVEVIKEEPAKTIPALPPNIVIPAPLQAVYKTIIEQLQLQRTYLEAIGARVETIDNKVHELYSQLK